MKLIKSPKAMQALCLKLKKKKSLGFVPTMGYLHAGHLKLVEVARKHSDIVLASIFVNPAQFGPNEDLSRYPRDLKGDLAKLKKAGVHAVFLPTPATIYPEDFQTYVTVEKVSQGLCGDARPGHFRGVATVVAKLFNIVQPDVAVFGKKDFQQFAVIKTMARDLNLPVKLIGVETVREKDGLAMSSRNAYLSLEERELGLSLSRGLRAVREACRKKTLTQDQMRQVFTDTLPRNASVRLDYIEARDSETLEILKEYKPRRTFLATAVFIGKTRLIDNIVF